MTTEPSPPAILFSTTLDFNPGDEVILMGIERLLALKGINYVKRIYNRNPEAGAQRQAVVTDHAPADYVIFAGTPEWSAEFPNLSDVLARGATALPWRRKLDPRFLGRLFKLRSTDQRNDPLLRYIIEHDLRCAALGVGSSKPPTPTHKINRILANNNDLLVVRDEQTAAAFRQQNPILAPCPAFFCAADPAPRRELKHVAITLQAPHSNLIQLSKDDQQKILVTLREVERLMGSVDIICHTRHDADFIRGHAPKLPIHIVTTGAEMVSTYDQFDVILSTRLHGCAAACSLGIPTFQLSHGLRMGTLRQFPVSNQDGTLSAADWLRDLDVAEQSAAVLAKKTEHRQRYLTLLDDLTIAAAITT